MEKNQLEDLKNTLEDKVKERTTELEQANREIARHSEARAEFFINLAHEVRTPLTVVKSAFDIFTQRHGHFKEIGTIRRNLDKLIRDMINFLDHEKLEQDRIFYNHSTACNVSRKVNRMVNLFNDMASVKNIMLHKSIAPGLHVMIDPDALERILYNLLDNALKYTQTGTITTTMTGDESHVYLEVTDTGIGIPADEIPNIFTSFYQITRKKRNNQGMGMGLVIVKKILDDVGGEISAKSTAGKGTTFTVTFVRSRSEDVECSGENPDSDEPFIEVVRQGVDDVISDKNVRSLFIVEDNPELLNYLAQHLRDEYNLYFALDGKEALKRIKSIPRPDAIISDIMMDNMNGYVLKDKLDEIQEYRTIPFMYMTAKTLKDDMIAGYQKGAVAYLKKPFSVDELKAKLTALITFRNSNTNGILEKSQKERRDKIEQYLIKKKIANRERELIYHVAEGKTNKEIGDLMNLTEGSVKAYLSRIYKKLKVNRNELTYLINSKELSGKNNSG